MPKILWKDLPALRDHLFERVRQREISAEDLYELKLWRESEPEAPQGLWCKDFGSFKLCGEGKYPKTFLLRGQHVKGVLHLQGPEGDHHSTRRDRAFIRWRSSSWVVADLSSHGKRANGRTGYVELSLLDQAPVP